MKCMYCRATMKRGTTRFQIDRRDVHVVLDKAPAWVCPQCGEPYFEPEDVERIQNMVRDIERLAREMGETV